MALQTTQRMLLHHEAATWRNATISHLLQLTGLQSTGTKAQMLLNLQNGLRQPRISPAPAHRGPLRILSIDMGIRNLAFCVLEVDHERMALRGSQGRRGAGPEVVALAGPSSNLKNAHDYIKVTAWRRISLLGMVREAQRVAEAAAEEDAGAGMGEGEAEAALPAAAFTPAVFSKVTYRLVKQVFAPFDISHVLIERQRHRSGGQSAVQEWTIRVNMFESMLHAVFEAMRCEAVVGRDALGADGGDARLPVLSATRQMLPLAHSVDPKKVAHFWCANAAHTAARLEGREGEMDGVEDGSNVKREAITKADKIKKAEGWLRPFAENAVGDDTKGNDEVNPRIACVGEAVVTKDAYLMAIDNVGKKRSERVPILDDFDARKLDDLADCLLQGVAWVQWELNRRVIANELLPERSTPSNVNGKEGQGGRRTLKALGMEEMNEGQGQRPGKTKKAKALTKTTTLANAIKGKRTVNLTG